MVVIEHLAKEWTEKEEEDSLLVILPRISPGDVHDTNISTIHHDLQQEELLGASSASNYAS